VKWGINLKLFVVVPDLKNDAEALKEARKLGDTLEMLGHEPDSAFMNSSVTSNKHLLSLAIQSDALLLAKGWQTSLESVFIVETAIELNIPMFILVDGELRPRFEIIGLSGYARSGKDTVGNFLIKKGYVRATFGDYIRKALYALNPYSTDGIRVKEIIDRYGWEECKKIDPEIRVLLQRMGSDVGRSLIDKDIWVDLVLKNIPDGSKIVFTDCRFPNEAAAIKNFGGEVWRVSRDGFEPANKHISDIILDDWDFDKTFLNNSSISELYKKIEESL
jgi:hypothetical protein